MYNSADVFIQCETIIQIIDLRTSVSVKKKNVWQTVRFTQWCLSHVSIQNAANGNAINVSSREKKLKIRLQIQKKPHGKIIDEEKTPWPPRDDIECALKRRLWVIAT